MIPLLVYVVKGFRTIGNSRNEVILLHWRRMVHRCRLIGLLHSLLDYWPSFLLRQGYWPPQRGLVWVALGSHIDWEFICSPHISLQIAAYLQMIVCRLSLGPPTWALSPNHMFVDLALEISSTTILQPFTCHFFQNILPYSFCFAAMQLLYCELLTFLELCRTIEHQFFNRYDGGSFLI